LIACKGPQAAAEKVPKLDSRRQKHLQMELQPKD